MWKRWLKILRLALPSLVSYASITLTGTLTLIILGHIDVVAIAVVGVANIVMYNVFALFSGFGHTLNYLVAQNYGANDMEKAIERTFLTLIMAGIISVLIALAGLFFAGDVLRLIGGEASSEIAVGGTYMQLRFFAMAFGIYNFVFHGFMRGIGDTRTPMILSMIANVTIVFLTYALAYGHFGFPELGLTGAGYAFLIGEALGAIGCMYVYFVRLHPRYNTRRIIKVDRAESALILKESGKLGLQEFCMSASMLIFTMFVARLGHIALAANEVSLNVMSLGFMPAFAFGATATILVGQEIGRNNPLNARRYGTETAVIGSLFLLAIGAIEFWLAEPIAKIYSTDPAVFELAALLIMISAFWQVVDGWLNFYAGGLRGIGDTTFLVFSSFLLGIFMFIPLSYLFIFVFDWGSIGAWVALYTYLTAFGISVMIRFYRTDWASVTIKSARSAQEESEKIYV